MCAPSRRSVIWSRTCDGAAFSSRSRSEPFIPMARPSCIFTRIPQDSLPICVKATTGNGSQSITPTNARACLLPWIGRSPRRAAAESEAGLPPAPHGYALSPCLFGTHLDLRFGQSAERMIDDHWDESAHTQRVALHLGLVQKLCGDNDRCRPAQCFESDAVMRTARSARPSVADRRQHNVVVGGNGLDQCGVRVLGKAFLAIVVDYGERGFLLELRNRLAQQPIGVPFGIVEHAQTQSVRAEHTRGQR